MVSFLLVLLTFSAAHTTSNAMYGPGSGPIAMDSVRCVGNEDRLTDCLFRLDTTGNSHDQDAGVSCVPCKFFFWWRRRWMAFLLV